MYVAIRRFAADPRYVGEVLRRIQEGLVPILRGVRGFAGFQVLDAGGGVLASIGVFETREAAERASERAAPWVQANLARFFRAPPQVTQGEVAFLLRSEGVARDAAVWR